MARTYGVDSIQVSILDELDGFHEAKLAFSCRTIGGLVVQLEEQKQIHIC
jgi:hypothetical protein